MTTKAKAAKGTTLTRAGVHIAQVTSFSGPKSTRNAIDATSHDSTAEEFIAGMPSSGEVSFDFLWVGSDAAQQALQADVDGTNSTPSPYVLTLPDHATNPSTFSFSAIVTSFELNPGGVNDAIKGSCALKISGAVTRTYAPN